MSSTLTIEPAERKKQSLSCELKFAMKRRYKDGIHRNFSEQDLDYFLGLLDAGIEDAKVVVGMIEKYGTVTISEEY